MNVTCADAQEMVQKQCDGEALPPDLEAALESHLAVCPACRAYGRDLSSIVNLIQRLPVERAPDGFVSAVMRQVAAPTPLARLGWLWAPTVGLAGLLLLVYQTLMRPGVSLLNLSAALAEWASLVDWSNLSSFVDAPSLFAWHVSSEFLVGASLLMIAVFGLMARAIARPPATGMPIRG